MGDNANTEKQLCKSKEERKKWMKSMMEIIDSLYNKTAEEKKKRLESYGKILDVALEIYLARARNRSYDVHRTKALAEAENYIKAERKWIAFKEIHEQCQKIENDVSFPTKQNMPLVLKESERIAVENVIYASQLFEDELPKLREARKMFETYFGLDLVLPALTAPKKINREIEKYQRERKEVIDAGKKKRIVKNVAKDIGIDVSLP